MSYFSLPPYALTVAYGAVLALLVQGHKFDKNLSGKLMQLAWKKAKRSRGWQRELASKAGASPLYLNCLCRAP